MTRRRGLLIALVLLALVVGIGAVVLDVAAADFVRAPNAERTPRTERPPDDVDLALRIAVGPPAATLDVWVLEPSAAEEAGPTPTVLVIHGLGDDKRSLLQAGRSFRDLGFRSVLVDVRGHGASSGAVLTFGVVEGRDMVQLLDALEARGVLDGPVGVYGTSYGGAIAHQLAGRDPRVRAVTTVAALSNLEDLMSAYAELSWPWVSWAIPDALLESYFPSRVAAHGHFRVHEADAASALRRSTASVRLFHGERDEVVPFMHALRLRDACAARGCELVPLPGRDHRGAMGDPAVGASARDFLRDALL